MGHVTAGDIADRVAQKALATQKSLEERVTALERWRIKCAGSHSGRRPGVGFYDGPFPDLPCNLGSLGFGDWFFYDDGLWMRTHDMDDGHTVWNAVGPHGGFLHLRKDTTVQPVPSPLKGGM